MSLYFSIWLLCNKPVYMFRMSLYFSIWLLCNKPVLYTVCPCTSESDCSVINRFICSGCPCTEGATRMPPLPPAISPGTWSRLGSVYRGVQPYRYRVWRPRGWVRRSRGWVRRSRGWVRRSGGWVWWYCRRSSETRILRYRIEKTVHPQHYNKAAMYLCTVVGDYINTIKTTFHLSFDC